MISKNQIEGDQAYIFELLQDGKGQRAVQMSNWFFGCVCVENTFVKLRSTLFVYYSFSPISFE